MSATFARWGGLVVLGFAALTAVGVGAALLLFPVEFRKSYELGTELSAGALSEVGIPQQAVPLALLFFNIGVELGQLIFIAAVFGFAWLVRHSPLRIPAIWPRAVAYGVGSVAAFWVVERTIAVF